MTGRHPLLSLLDQSTLRVVGLMSGTSLDGIDAALVEIDRDPFAVRLIAFDSRPYTDAELERVRALLAGDTATLCQGNFWLGERFAEAVQRVLATAQLSAEQLDLIGSHGQTVWHQPPSRSSGEQIASTLQLGEPAVIAARLGCTTVGDFRVADLALGGEGAPLVPFLDALLYQRADRPRALQNLGGIGNITFLVDGHPPLAFDTGPGNMVSDAIVGSLTEGRERFDREGARAARGHVSDSLLGEMLEADADYQNERPPKSTGRERYGVDYAKWVLSRAVALHVSPDDVVRTVIAFTAETVARSLQFAPKPIEEILISGGGVHNLALRAELAQRCRGVAIRSLAEEGLDPDAKEAVAFAVMAAHTIWGRPSNLPTVTGARRAAILGKICLP